MRFLDHVDRLLVGAETEISRLAKLAFARPLRKFFISAISGGASDSVRLMEIA
jgi:hypothetical protein